MTQLTAVDRDTFRTRMTGAFRVLERAVEQGFGWRSTFRSGKGADATVKAEKIASLDKPAALCFGPKGELYVAEFGTQPEGSKDRPGRVVKFDAGL